MAKEKDRAAVRIIPPLVPLFVVLLGVGLKWLWPLALPFEMASPGRWWLGGLIVTAAFVVLGLPSVINFRRHGENEIPWTPTNQIIVSGPYRFTRNPMYLMMVIICLGLAVIGWNLWTLILTPLGALALQNLAIKPEEDYLTAKFGDNYRDYKARVRRWI